MSDIAIADKKMPAASNAEQNGPASLLEIISRAATNPQCDIGKMQSLLEMQQKIQERQDIMEFNTAMSDASGEIPQIQKNGKVSLGGKGGYSFARWEDMDKAIRPILRKHNLRLSFTSRASEGGVKTIIGIITHKNGQYQTAEMDLPPDAGQGRNAIQAVGSTISYAKRYCTEMLLNIVRTDEDKDGVSTVRPQNKEVITPQQKNAIVNALQKLETGPGQILSYVGVEALDDIPANYFKRVMDYLEKNMSKRGIKP
ncbi:hypothetical protein GS501_00195 [Saccharibacter sp. 17.LH.SD]|uniref:ERF family protein n=1 Tax=Saccharibacter sp. 17.LH.SD TaxID=2689393 RepID=UPI001368E720|nr:ERF family protein [Saccharibacter sp. 17.LH.SD]MXV43501.1 hypothetical protein [Saccharibacter sp. 17.LH.SD]